MKLSRTAFISLLIIVNIAIDQISKFWVRANVSEGSQSSIFGQVFTLHNVKNEGAFLGMGSDLTDPWRTILLLILPVIVLGLVVIHIIRDKTIDNMSLIGFCCIIGGGIANVYDRFAYGWVTDFLHLDFGWKFRTGIFNIADVSVSTGMIMILVASFLYRKKENIKE
ncbi:MAG: signal peptidase II [Flavobacteriaceae bacterium]|nr:signal peptidase II [Flavobacteriaceae bacterium]